MLIEKGILKEFKGSWGSGMGFLAIEINGSVKDFPCDNGTTVRSLEAAFGNVITEGHTASGNGFKDQEVFFSVDDFGVLAGFTPVAEARSELIDAYEHERDLK